MQKNWLSLGKGTRWVGGQERKRFIFHIIYSLWRIKTFLIKKVLYLVFASSIGKKQLLDSLWSLTCREQDWETSEEAVSAAQERRWRSDRIQDMFSMERTCQQIGCGLAQRREISNAPQVFGQSKPCGRRCHLQS